MLLAGGGGGAINDRFEFCHYSLTYKPEYYGSTVPLMRIAIQDQIQFSGQAQRSGKSKGCGKGKPAKSKAKKKAPQSTPGNCAKSSSEADYASRSSRTHA